MDILFHSFEPEHRSNTLCHEYGAYDTNNYRKITCESCLLKLGEIVTLKMIVATINAIERELKGVDERDMTNLERRISRHILGLKRDITIVDWEK